MFFPFVSAAKLGCMLAPLACWMQACVLVARCARASNLRTGTPGQKLFAGPADDYALKDALIRIWTRTAVRKQVTSFGTFLSTLCHEFCHHLNCQKFGFARSPHTRGFYERAGLLYHHARGTPVKKLFWAQLPGGRWRIDWARTNSVQRTADQILSFSSRSYSGKRPSDQDGRPERST